MMRWEGYVARIGETDVYTVFWWGNMEGKELERPKIRWKNKIKMDL